MSINVHRSVRAGLLLAAALAASSSPAARAECTPKTTIKTLDSKSLTVCLYPGFAPFVDKKPDPKPGEDPWEGWDVTFLKSFAAANCLDFKVAEQEKFDNIWLLPGQGKCDIAGTGISDTAPRRAATKAAGQVGCWSSTYYGVLRTFLVRTEEAGRLDDVRDLAGRTAVVTKGSTANVDLCYRMRLAGLNPCVKDDLDRPCNFAGLQGLREATRMEDGACVDIRYPQDDDEKNAACAISNSDVYKKAVCPKTKPDGSPQPFTYGGGYGSIRILTDTPDQSLATVWAHCNMGSDFQAYAEPFSFVVRAESTGLLAALDDYIAKTQAQPAEGTPYPGTPIPDLGCPIPPWTKDEQPEVCRH